MKLNSSLFIALILIFVACGQTEQERALQDERQMQMQMQMVESTPEFNTHLEAVLDHYFDLKDALVESDAQSASQAAELYLEQVNDINPESLNSESEALWVSFSEIITNNTREMIPLKDVDDQRYHFEFISEEMIEMVDTFRPVGYEIYHQTCPMVRGGSADWLSREEQISNPYHGDRMLRCGEVIRRI